MSVKSGLAEDPFPQLPIRKQKERTQSRRSSISSVSSLSICNRVGRPTPAVWFKELAQDAVCRRHLFCKCKSCKAQFISKRNWNNLTRCPCEESVVLEEGEEVKLIATRNYGKRGDVVVFVLVPTEQVQGWVHPDCLGGLETVRFALQQKEVADNLNTLKKDFERAEARLEQHQTWNESKPVATFVPNKLPTNAFESKYKFNELVLAREALGQPWYQAVVTSTNPLKLKSSNHEGIRVFDERNVKKHPTSQFVAVQDIKVRTQENPKSFAKKTLSKGTVLNVVQMKGFQARITGPEIGWVQMRSVNELFAVEKNYQFQFVQPRLFVGGLPMETSKIDLARAFQRVDGVILPSSIQLFASGDSLCARVHLMKSSDYSKVVGKRITVRGQEVSCEFCLEYLRSKAARKLRRK